jgi:hypothetical protein
MIHNVFRKNIPGISSVMSLTKPNCVKPMMLGSCILSKRNKQLRNFSLSGTITTLISEDDVPPERSWR